MLTFVFGGFAGKYAALRNIFVVSKGLSCLANNFCKRQCNNNSHAFHSLLEMSVEGKFGQEYNWENLLPPDTPSSATHTASFLGTLLAPISKAPLDGSKIASCSLLLHGELCGFCAVKFFKNHPQPPCKHLHLI